MFKDAWRTNNILSNGQNDARSQVFKISSFKRISLFGMAANS